MSKKNCLLALLSFILLVFGLGINALCQKQESGMREKNTHVIEWDATSIDRCTFKLDGTRLGKGDDGFKATVNKIADLPKESFLIFKVSASVMSEYVHLYDSVDSLPIGNDASARQMFHQAIDGKISELKVE